MITVCNVTKRHHRAGPLILAGVSLSVARGQIHGLLGPNGAGKSTLMRLICGLIQPDSGSVQVAGLNMRQPQRSVFAHIGFVPQSLAFYPELTVAENLKIFAVLRNCSGARQQECLEIAQLQHHLGRTAQLLSGGLQRRLNFAIGLLGNPKVLLLDEPTVGVDPQSRHFLLERLKTLAHSGLSILYATHYMDEVSRLCDQVTVIDRGVVVAQDTPAVLAPDGNLEALFLQKTGTALRDAP